MYSMSFRPLSPASGLQQVTPWGQPESVEQIAPGIQLYSTASHGGFYLDQKSNAKIPFVLKASSFCRQGFSGWYEEDCDAAIVVYCFKEHFNESTNKLAVESLKKFHAKAWRALQHQNRWQKKNRY